MSSFVSPSLEFDFDLSSDRRRIDSRRRCRESHLDAHRQKTKGQQEEKASRLDVGSSLHSTQSSSRTRYGRENIIFLIFAPTRLISFIDIIEIFLFKMRKLERQFFVFSLAEVMLLVCLDLVHIKRYRWQ